MAVNAALIAGRRHQALATIDNLLAQLQSEVGAAGGDASLRSRLLGPLETSATGRRQEASLTSHRPNAGAGGFDAALAKIEETLKLTGAQLTPDGGATPDPPKPIIKIAESSNRPDWCRRRTWKP